MRLCNAVGVLLIVASLIPWADGKGSPFIIIHGYGASQMEARFDGSSDSSCRPKMPWHHYWLIPKMFDGPEAECLVDNFKLRMNDKTGRMENADGAFFRNFQFGNTTGVEFVDKEKNLEYFYTLVETLCRDHGYERGESVLAAPYDFRYDPDSDTAEKYFNKLIKLIEDTYDNYKQQKVVVLSQSMGVPYTLNFWHKQPQAWKTKYIKAWISTSGPYGGAVEALAGYVSGSSVGFDPTAEELKVIREFMITFSSSAFVLPDKRFWPEDEVLLVADGKEYSTGNLKEFFQDLGFPLGEKIHEYVPPVWDPSPPGVKIYCFHGSGFDTAAGLRYNTLQDGDSRTTIVGGGDGVVNKRSLEGCTKFDSSVDVTHRVFEGDSHDGMLLNPAFIDEVVKILNAPE